MKKETTLSANVRTVSLVENEVDYQSVLNEFEDGELTKAGALTTFTGGQMLDASVFEEFDNVRESDLETLSDCKVSYKFTYDSESNIVTIFAELINETGEMELDEISGVGFINDAGEIDAVMNVDGEGILLSEMREAGLIENCGWFSRAIKKIAKKVVKTVAIVAATAVVATIAVTSPAVVAIGLGIVATVNVVNEAVTQTMAYKNY